MSNKFAVKNPRCLISQGEQVRRRPKPTEEAIVCGGYLVFRVADAGRPRSAKPAIVSTDCLWSVPFLPVQPPISGKFIREQDLGR